MKKLTLGVAALIITTICCHARIGWTAAEMQKKYGKPIDEEILFKVIPKKAYRITVNNQPFMIIAKFRAGNVVQVIYAKMKKPGQFRAGKMTMNEALALMKLNLPQGGWKKQNGLAIDSSWDTADGKHQAQLHMMGKYFAIYNVAAYKIETQLRDADEQKKVTRGGF